MSNPPNQSQPGVRSFMDCMAEIRALQSSHPEWFAYFEDTDPDVCSEADLFRMIDTAPSNVARAFLVGKMTLRQQIAAITGRPML